MAVDQSAAMPRHMFDDANHAALRQSLQRRATQRRHSHRFGPQSPVTHDVACPILPHIEQGQRVDGDADFRKRQGDGMGIGPRCCDRARRRDIIKTIEHRAGRKRGPDWRLHPGDAPPLLIDHDQQVVATMQGAQIIGQRPQLRPIDDIALEDNIACGLRLGKEGALVRGQGWPGQAENNRLHGIVGNDLRRPCRRTLSALSLPSGSFHPPP
ncbi:MAG: hypothetical protein A2095_13930 [Sphingomonadales bacterium GWF1_63_6]|nr:MAG: hypothetical protein A2095_13930 [Sphingomonadales bacterium GWF1_63_6]